MVIFKPSSSSSGTMPSKSPLHQTFSESLMVDSIETAKSIIGKWISLEHSDSPSSYCSLALLFSTGNRQEAKQYTDAVNSLHNSMQRLIRVDPNSSNLIRAQKLMQIAMKFLETEFYRILKSKRQYLEPDSVSVHSSGCVKEGEDGADVLIDLKLIADCMISCGYGNECVKIHKNVRKSIVNHGLVQLGFEHLKISQMQKMEWEVLEAKIQKWLRVVKIAIKTLFHGEKILCDVVFSASEAVRISCFESIAIDGALALFEFPKTVAKCERSFEKIFRMLDMYDAVSSLIPEIDALFFRDSVRSQIAESLVEIGNAVRLMLEKFESSISEESSKSTLAGGGVHPLTRYVMNFIVFLADYSDSLSEILAQKPQSHKYAAVYSSPVSNKLAWLILVLICKINGKATVYNDIALSYLSLANNLQYIVVKVRTSEQIRLLGEDWIADHEEKVKQYADKYEKQAWGRVLETLFPAETLRHDEAENRFRRFNAAFVEAYSKQMGWVVPDPKLRDAIKVSVERKLVPAYSELYRRHFVGSWECSLVRSSSVVKYAPEDLTNCLSDLFLSAAGGSKSVGPSVSNNLGSDSDSLRFGR